MAFGAGFNIADFKTQIKNGLLKPNLYQVTFSPKKTTALPEKLRFFTDSINIPSIDLDTQMIRRFGYGPIEYVPFRAIFGPVSMSFMVESTQQNILYNVLNTMSGTSSFMYSGSMADTNKSVFGTMIRPYEVEYKENIIFDLEVDVYNEAGNSISIITLRDCFIKQIGSINLSWASNDQYLRVDVTFLATNYSILTKDAPSNGNQKNSGIGNGQTNPAGAPQEVKDSLNRAAAGITDVPVFLGPNG